MKKITWLFPIIAIVYLLSVGVDTMDEDASQYASMSREMAASGSYLQVYEQGVDYLDKPPFLFWINSVSILLFGENNFAFKFPSFLFALLAIYATYRFAGIYYNKLIAQWSALILASFQALFLITNDVRTDTILMGFTALSIWQLAAWFQQKKLLNFIIASLAIAGGMLTKGPIALIVPVLAFGSHLLLQRNFKALFQPIYLLGVAIIAIVLIPMSIGLYQQFDLHPEKFVNGSYQVSGLRFFYWTQSFGRITGESVWNNGAGFGFLFENLLWGLLPFTLFFIAGLIQNFYTLTQQKLRIFTSQEFITTGGFTLSYCALGISKYQLPHYIYIALPFIAIITATSFVNIILEQRTKWLSQILIPLQYFIITVLFGLGAWLLLVAFPANNWLGLTLLILGLLVIIITHFFQPIHKALAISSLWGIITINAVLNISIYPSLLTYQAGNVVGRWVHQQQIATNNFVLFKEDFSIRNIHFYAHRIVPIIKEVKQLQQGNYLLTGKQGLQEIISQQIPYRVVKSGLAYHVAELTPQFLDPKTRASVCKTYYVVQLL